MPFKWNGYQAYSKAKKKKIAKEFKRKWTPDKYIAAKRMDRPGERGMKRKKNEKRKKAKKHAENYLQWQWCNSDNEIRITTHWRKLNLHFFTINCERGRLVSGRYSCDMNMKQVANHRHVHLHSATTKWIGWSERTKEKKKGKKCIQNTKTNILYVYISLCAFPFPLLHHSVLFFILLFISQCVSFVLFFLLHLKIWNDGWWCADTQLSLCYVNGNMKTTSEKATKKSWSNTQKIMCSVCLAR